MNGYERYENLRSERMRAERERVFDEWLLERLQTQSKAESVQALFRSLTFIVGTSDMEESRKQKTLV
jgi:hypothetical protein